MKKVLNLGLISALVFILIIDFAMAVVVESVEMSPKEITPGQIVDIVILLRNNAPENAENVQVNLDLENLPFAPYDSGSDFSVSEIEDGESRVAKFEIKVLENTQSGTYKIPIKISYDEKDDDDKTITKTRESLMSIIVNSKPLIDVTIENNILLKGQKATISVKVINKGISDIKFLEVEVNGGNSYTILSQRKNYIGDLDSDDFSSVDYEIFFKEISANSVNIPVNLRYKDLLNKEYNEDYVTNLKVYSQKEAETLGLIEKNNIFYIVILVIVLITGFFIYRSIRRRKTKEYQN